MRISQLDADTEFQDHRYFAAHVAQSQCVVVCGVRCGESTCDGNPGFYELFSNAKVPVVQELFAGPTWAQLTQWCADAVSEGPVYQGIINLACDRQHTVSLQGSVVADPARRTLLIVAEHELRAWSHLRESVVQLNQELTESQRQLVRDIQARKRVEQQLREANLGLRSLHTELEEKATALKRSAELRERLHAYTTHELRTPIHAILGLSDLLLPTSGPESSEALRHIRQSARNLLRLVNDLLDLAKVTADKVDVVVHPFSLRELLDNLRGTLQVLVPSTAVELFVQTAPENLLLNGDEPKIGQILRNLVNNALQATEHGAVRLEWEMINDTQLCFIVSDTGRGIPESALHTIFDDFAQVRHDDGPKPRGTGLGLPLSRRLARAMGGDIRVESRVLHGSRFTLELPIPLAL